MPSNPQTDYALTWHTSSYSNTQGGDCVEVADGIPDAVPVRDSKNPDGPTLTFSTAAWQDFVHALKRGELTGA